MIIAKTMMVLINDNDLVMISYDGAHRLCGSTSPITSRRVLSHRLMPSPGLLMVRLVHVYIMHTASGLCVNQRGLDLDLRFRDKIHAVIRSRD